MDCKETAGELKDLDVEDLKVFFRGYLDGFPRHVVVKDPVTGPDARVYVPREPLLALFAKMAAGSVNPDERIDPDCIETWRSRLQELIVERPHEVVAETEVTLS